MPTLVDHAGTVLEFGTKSLLGPRVMIFSTMRRDVKFERRAIFAELRFFSFDLCHVILVTQSYTTFHHAGAIITFLGHF